MSHSLEIHEVELDKINIVKRPYDFASDARSVEDLKESINRIGLKTPIVLFKKKNNKLYIQDGKNRFLAAKELGFKTIKAVIVEVKE